MSASYPGRLQVAIVCEDVRKELGNKRSLIGVFSGDVVVGEFPATLSLAAYFEYITDVAGMFDIEFVVYFGDRQVAKFEAGLSVVEPDQPSVMDLPRMNLTVLGPGDIRIEMGTKPNAPETIITKRVMLATPGLPGLPPS
jgi:hypothetical protein